MWLVFVDGGFDLDLEEYRFVEERGQLPEWARESLSMDGWEGILETRLEGVAWAKHEGLAPGQPFLLKLEKPVYTHYSSFEGDEWDCEWPWKILKKLPLSETTINRRWVQIEKSIAAFEAARKAKEQALRDLQLSDIDAFYLTTETYICGYHDDMPSGIRVNLVSKHTGHKVGGGCRLFSGDDPGGSFDNALEDLATQLKKSPLKLSMEQLRTLPHGWLW